MPIAVHARGLKEFSKELRRLSPELAKALKAELREIGDQVRDEIRSGVDAPRSRTGERDSMGKAGRKRASVKTSSTMKGVSIFSKEPDAAVWNWGGSIAPRGAVINIPRTEFLSGPAVEGADRVAEEMGEITDRLAARYADFSGF